MKIYIINMICRRTRPLVIKELSRLGFRYTTFASDILYFEKDLSQKEIKVLGLSLSQFGIEMAVGDSKLASGPARDCIRKLRSFDI
jgi:hypothetical protein